MKWRARVRMRTRPVATFVSCHTHTHTPNSRSHLWEFTAFAKRSSREILRVLASHQVIIWHQESTKNGRTIEFEISRFKLKCTSEWIDAYAADSYDL